MILKNILIFFFQAEDGIRDGHVTGVQTCALPIFPKEAGTNSNPNLNYIPGPDDERMDNEKALEASAKYVKGLLKHYNNDPVLAYASYNWGQGNMDKYLAGSLNTIPDETEEYIKKIFHTSLSQYIQSKGLRKQ